MAHLTYVRLKGEFVYLAMILGGFSRKVVGWALDRTLMSSRHTVAALERAVAARQPTMSNGTPKPGESAASFIEKVVFDTRFKGYVHHASSEDPQHLIKSDKTDHVAIHKGTALKRIRARTRKTGAIGKKR